VRSDLQALACAIEAVQGRATKKNAPLATLWSSIDQALKGGLLRGAVHEWFAHPHSSIEWHPPLGIFIHLAGGAFDEGGGKAVVWIGRRCWPNPHAMIRDARERTLLQRSLLVDPPDGAGRLWAIDLALRSPAIAAVIADGSGLDMPQSRRLQLAAEAGAALALIARPSAERHQLSAATTRWLVQPAPVAAPLRNPRWTVHLLRCKGMQPDLNVPRSWTLEWNGKGVVHQSADVAHRPGAPTRSETLRQSVARISA
jgi:protein ImuA